MNRLSEIGAEPAGGLSRIPFSPEERAAHDLLSGLMRELGLSVRTDSFGNTFGTLPGTDPTLPAIGFGSHLDSVPHGGRFDGSVGVLGALEVLRMFKETGVETAHPLMLVVFASEEGARFGELASVARPSPVSCSRPTWSGCATPTGTRLARPCAP